VPATERAKFVDVGGVPTDWSFTGRRRPRERDARLKIMPVVVEARPGGEAPRRVRLAAPRRRRVRGLRSRAGRRYGNAGTFWTANPDVPKVPLEQWQIWNEPNIADFWSEQPSAKAYVALLKRAAPAIRNADPRARIVLSGLVNKSWTTFATSTRRVAQYFDTVAYTRSRRRSAGHHDPRAQTARDEEYGDARKPMVAPSSPGRRPPARSRATSTSASRSTSCTRRRACASPTSGSRPSATSCISRAPTGSRG